MSGTDDTQTRIRNAAGITDLLDAAYHAFEELLTLIRGFRDPSGPLYLPMVLAGASAANGRDWLGQAPSLPRSPHRTATDPGRPPGQDAGQVTNLCDALVAVLEGPVAAAAPPDDQRACAGAARCAREITDLLSGPA